MKFFEGRLWQLKKEGKSIINITGNNNGMFVLNMPDIPDGKVVYAPVCPKNCAAVAARTKKASTP